MQLAVFSVTITSVIRCLVFNLTGSFLTLFLGPLKTCDGSTSTRPFLELTKFDIDRISLHYSVTSIRYINYAASWGGRCGVGRVGHGPPKILVGWATMHLAPPIIGLYVC